MSLFGKPAGEYDVAIQNRPGSVCDRILLVIAEEDGQALAAAVATAVVAWASVGVT